MKMSKTFSVLFFVLCIVLSLTACTEDEDTPTIVETDDTEVQESQEYEAGIPAWFELRSIAIEPDTADGVTKAAMATAEYEFHGRTEEANINLARIAELAVSVLEREYGYSPPSGNTITFIGEEGILVSEFSLEVYQMVSDDRVIINPDSPDSVGALFYGAGGNLLPAWLAVGLELYWSDKSGFERFVFDKDFDLIAWQMIVLEYQLPAFGDFSFVYTGDAGRLPMYFALVKWLSENELLNDIVRAYLDDKQDEGDILFADAWLKLTGHDMRGDFFFDNRLRHLYGHYLQTYNWDAEAYIFESFNFSASTEYGNYLVDWLTRYDIMAEFISSVDMQYAYAKQWFGFEDFPPIPTRIMFDRINGTYAHSEYVFLPGNDMVGGIHEATHYLLGSNNIHADFFWLGEGLCMALMYIYASHDPEGYGVEKEGDSTLNFKWLAHWRALRDVNYLIENDRYTDVRAFGVRAEDRPSASPQGLLKTYETAASFVIYMLEIGSREDFMRLYVDTSAAEELYGKDFNALYEQWLEFLSQI
jgi:hypothetical protein